jgi:membrane-associated phospholipid phosphatase
LASTTRASRSTELLVTAGGLGVVVAGGWLARRSVPSQREQRWFAWLNQLPVTWFPPVWLVMQLGSLGGVVTASAAAAAAGEPRVARRAAVAGTTTWLAANVVKQLARRGRPASVLDVTRVLGREQSGLGYPSGHAAVTTAMAVAVAPVAPRQWRGAIVAAPVVVSLARGYVGAHLPLDLAGGVALGVAAGAAVRAVDPMPVTGRGRHRCPPGARDAAPVSPATRRRRGGRRRA